MTGNKLSGKGRKVTGNGLPVALTSPPVPGKSRHDSKGVEAENPVDKYIFDDPNQEASESSDSVSFDVIPLEAFCDSPTINEMGDERGSWKEVSEGQQNAIQAIKSREKATGVLIRCQSNKDRLSDSIHPKLFARSVGLWSNCFHHVHQKTADGDDEFAWVICNVQNRETRQFIKWTAMEIFLYSWAADNDVDVDSLRADGTIVTPDGSMVDSPYMLDGVSTSDN